MPGGSWAAPLFVIGPEGSGGAAALKGDDFGLVSFSPPVSARLARLRRQGATVDLPAVKRTHPAAIGCMTLIAVPIRAVLIGCAVALAGIALAIDMLFLTPVLAIAHIILRQFLGG